jgi:hypothetical protein
LKKKEKKDPLKYILHFLYFLCVLFKLNPKRSPLLF